MEKKIPEKSYLDPEKKARMLANGMSMDSIYLAESGAALRAGDEDTYWRWLTLRTLTPASLKMIKRLKGSEFIEKMGFDTSRADQKYGKGWLDGS